MTKPRFIYTFEMKLEKIFVFMEPYDYNYRGQGFYIYPWSYNSYDQFQDGLKEKYADYPPEVEEWEFVDSDGINAFCVDMDGVSEKNWEYLKELEDFGQDIGLDIYEIVEVAKYWDGKQDVDDLRDKHQGRYDSIEDYAYDLLDDIGISDDLAERYFSFDKLGYALKVGGDLDAMFVDDWEDNYGSEDEAIDALEKFERDHNDEEIGEWYVYEVLGNLSSLGADSMKDFFDYKKFARDLSHDYELISGHIWSNN